jgi:transposase
MPLVASMLDGNTSDHEANRGHIAQLASLVRPDDEVTFVADCKLVDKNTVGQLLDENFHFISLLPGTFAQRKQLIDTAHEQDIELMELAREPGRTKDKPDRVYRGTSYIQSFPVQDPHIVGNEGLRTERMRFLLVESSQLAAKFDSSLEGKLEREAKRFEKALQKTTKKPFSCHDDAAKSRDKLLKTLKLHCAKVDVVGKEVTLKRSRTGRPRKGEEPPTETQYRLVLCELTPDTDAIEQARLYARHFVLITDHIDKATWSDEQVFAEYRKQHIIENHSGFRWFKREAAVAPMFLKTPRRIAALCLVFVLALMVRNFLQFTLRQRLLEEDEMVPYYGRRPDTQKPTAEVVLNLFAGVQVVHVIVDGEVVERRLAHLGDAAHKVLRLLDIAVEVFTRVREKPMLWVGGIP